MTADNQQATARAHPNIAFIKYWGNLDHDLRLPANASLSMNLAELFTETTVRWDNTLSADRFVLNGAEVVGTPSQRVSKHLDHLCSYLKRPRVCASVESHNNFPIGAGVASSAAAFAALTLAGVAANGVTLAESELSVLARLGSGSAARSIPGGFVEWRTGATSHESFAFTIAPAEYWELTDVIAVISTEHKATGSTEGHQSADTSDLQSARVAGANRRLKLCREAILQRDFASFAEIVEADSNLMHAVMMTSRPPLFYWQPTSLAVMASVRHWRQEGLQVCYTLDAGPNVHCICINDSANEVSGRFKTLSGVQNVLVARPGGAAYLVSQPE